ncbi:hypothetical protein CNBG1550 [Cryptococcus deneoformans B-3501A]|uniref:hypothetical protein n=1 Tax=Cryptococcus deneoformans (strain B-3501A) TaxID=283643 RepID=UPI000042FE8C|nr:hypothetical protein CNBG1550 [Cryptococcus neoformans var. neoformans B-3501A]EAL19863.1 hypothetical protein CNBG1550 [Cryptococcus neoformans var. neoformans B-3501A]
MPGTNVVSESGNKKWALLNWRPKKVEEEDGGMSGNEEMGMTGFLLKFGEGMYGKSLFLHCIFLPLLSASLTSLEALSPSFLTWK